MFSDLKIFVPHLDKIFTAFYHHLTKNERYAIYFETTEQVEELIKKQKQNLIDSLDDDLDKFEKRNNDIGIIHYNFKIPYVDFLQGTDILSQEMTKVAASTLIF